MLKLWSTAKLVVIATAEIQEVFTNMLIKTVFPTHLVNNMWPKISTRAVDLWIFARTVEALLPQKVMMVRITAGLLTTRSTMSVITIQSLELTK